MGVSSATTSKKMEALAIGQKASDYMQTPDALGAWRAKEYGSPTGAITTATLNQRYGRWGRPWGNVPPALDAHLRRLTGFDRARMYEMVDDESHQGQDYAKEMTNTGFMGTLPKKQLNWPSTGIQRSKDIKLVEEAPGRWVWSGWEKDPEWLAYKEGLGQQRMIAAKQRVKDQPEPWSSAIFKEEDEEMLNIARLFGSYEDRGQGLRFGQTEATKGGSAWPSDPSQEGYLGQQSAAFSPIAQSSKEE